MKRWQSHRDKLTTTEARLRHWQQENTILKVTELICERMKKQGVSRKQLADRLDRTPGFVTQLLDGNKNMTIRTIADIFTSLGLQFEPGYSPLQSGASVSVNSLGAEYQSTPTGRVVFEVVAELSVPAGTASQRVTVSGAVNG